MYLNPKLDLSVHRRIIRGINLMHVIYNKFQTLSLNAIQDLIKYKTFVCIWQHFYLKNQNGIYCDQIYKKGMY